MSVTKERDPAARSPFRLSPNISIASGNGANWAIEKQKGQEKARERPNGAGILGVAVVQRDVHTVAGCRMDLGSGCFL